MGFSDTGSLATLSSGSLAAAIGAATNSAGIPLVDTGALASNVFNGVLPGAGNFISGFVDCTKAISYHLALTPHNTLANPSVVTLTLALIWYEADQTTIASVNTFEVNAYQDTSGNDATTYITDRAISPFCRLYLIAKSASITTFKASFATSGRPADRLRIVENTPGANGVTAGNNPDGLLLSFSTPNIAIGGTATMVAPLTSGPVVLKSAVGTSACSLAYGWGASRAAGFTLSPAVGGAEDVRTLYAPNRPLQCLITNTGGIANGRAFISYWTTGD